MRNKQIRQERQEMRGRRESVMNETTTDRNNESELQDNGVKEVKYGSKRSRKQESRRKIKR